MKKILPYTLLLAGLSTLAGCSKNFLNRPPISSLTSGNFYQTDAEVMAGTAPLYNITWFDYNDKAFLAFGVARGGSLNSNDRTPYIEFDPSSTDQTTLLTGYKAFYKIVAQSNLTMQNIVDAKNATVSDSIRSYGLAECHFMRGLAYYYLVSNWGAVPIIYDNTNQLSDSLLRNTIESVWQFILMDMRYAVNHLPTASYQPGRINKYSAEGMLAKFYLIRSGLDKTLGNRTQSDLDSAKYFASDVISNSGMSLPSDYYNEFVGVNNNAATLDPESLFSLLWQPVNSPWGVNNSFQAYMAFEPQITQTGDGWGSAQGGSAALIKYFLANPNDSIRRKATIMFPGDFYAELDKKDNGVTVPNTTNYAYIKKYVIGSPADNNNLGAFMAAYTNTIILRLAEVYLIYAEATMGNNTSTTDATALAAFNAVRTRAGMPTLTSIAFSDIFQEKWIETAIEGNEWYDILRWYYFDPIDAEAYVTAQDRGISYTLTWVPGSFSPRRYTFTSSGEHFSFNANNVYLPFPEQEMEQAPSLSKTPVPFNFSVLPNY
ncbi:RagB/SusD family nutrient uptake outer membrane protein [Dinghuibacter silviterrae]|uniref:Putative outer membrane starch-binding protein n=1 Tax=Dinghuibacter silviterrae TaxID=1539049 RepID=A0A4R8DJT9_9BACT|nr:RagB/SusD family nutrient uptake outer membrane protein [Dinghuibacter silviterrae]TDW97584.1 putative outer membrane starch-binding protein [Dinghuibacter silviterrae]